MTINNFPGVFDRFADGIILLNARITLLLVRFVE